MNKKLPDIIPASLARTNFYTILEEVDTTFKRFTVTKNGKAKAIIMSPEEVGSWEETMEILSNKKLMKTLRESAEDFRKGKIVTYEEFLNEI